MWWFPTLYSLDKRLTIITKPSSPAADPQALALNALGWVLGDPARADRLLALTGLTPDVLRAALDRPETLAAVLDFLCAHEPDLLAASEALQVEPAQIAEARHRLAS